MSARNKNTEAFTLIELLVVIAIIGLLASIVLVALNQARVKSRDAKRVADLRQIQTALELYYSDSGAYPSMDCESTAGGAWSACWSTFLPSQYISQISSDPLNTPSTYGYYYNHAWKPTGPCSWTHTGSLNDYMLLTRLENPNSIPNSCAGGLPTAFDNPNLNYMVGQ